MLPNTYHYGRFQLGQYVPLFVQTTNTSGTATNPSAAPTCDVRSGGGTLVIDDQKIPPKDAGRTTGAFEYGQLLDDNFSAGKYFAFFSFTVGGTGMRALGMFEVLAGLTNADDGPLTSLVFLGSPDADRLVGQTADAQNLIGRAPYVDGA